MANNNLTRKVGETLSAFKTLKWLSVKQNSLGDGGVEKLLAMPNLEFLDLSDTDITDKLEVLLSQCEKRGVKVIVENNPMLNPDHFRVPYNLAQSSVYFRGKTLTHVEEPPLRGAEKVEKVAKFGM